MLLLPLCGVLSHGSLLEDEYQISLRRHSDIVRKMVLDKESAFMYENIAVQQSQVIRVQSQPVQVIQ